MAGWHTKNLGDALLATIELEHIKDLFLSVYADADTDDARALFIRHESDGRLHCEAKLYFSPAATSVAEMVHATPCRRPAPEGLGLLVGAAASRSLLIER